MSNTLYIELKEVIKMDWFKLVYLVILLVCGILVFIAPFSKKGDERREYINAKARTYAFTVVIGMLTIDIARAIYLTIQGSTSYQSAGSSPISFLSVTLIIYLITVVVYGKKYGD